MTALPITPQNTLQVRQDMHYGIPCKAFKFSLSFLANAQCPVIAVLLHNTQHVLSMIPVSIIQDTLMQVREYLTNMKLFIEGIDFVFLQKNGIIPTQDVNHTHSELPIGRNDSYHNNPSRICIPLSYQLQSMSCHSYLSIGNPVSFYRSSYP